MSEEQDLYQSLFSSLVYTFNMTAMQQLGKVVNPITNKQELDLEQSKLTIDMLNMLSDRTKGNLSEEENQFLTQTILFLNKVFDEEIKK